MTTECVVGTQPMADIVAAAIITLEHTWNTPVATNKSPGAPICASALSFPSLAWFFSVALIST